MDVLSLQLLLPIVIGLVLGVLVAWLFLRGREAGVRTELATVRAHATRADATLDAERVAAKATIAEIEQRRHEADLARQEAVTRLDAERRTFADRVATLEQAETRLTGVFETVSQQVLQRSNAAFLELAATRFQTLQETATTTIDGRRTAIDELVKPIHAGLEHVGKVLAELNLERAATQSQIEQQLRSISEQHAKLAGETQNLVKALRTPQARGRWGELQLRRVVELAGMQDHCDFTEQETLRDDERALRPDLIVTLPGEKVIVVDSKVPLDAYLSALEASTDDERERHLDRHAKQVRAHVSALSSKDYSHQLSGAPDFVVLFMPGEVFFSAACQRDFTIIEDALKLNVMIASPTSLITLLKAVAYGWQQERVGKNAERIRDLAIELYQRVGKLGEHLTKLGKGLDNAVDSFNDVVGSMESRFLPTARRFQALAIQEGNDIAVVERLDVRSRALTAGELVAAESVAAESIAEATS